MSINDQALMQKLETKYKNGVLSREIIELIAKLEGKQYFIEEVEECLGDLYLYSFSIEISALEDARSDQELAGYFSSVPLEHKFDAIYLGEIKVYYQMATNSTSPESVGVHRLLSRNWTGALFVAFDGSFWVFSEDVVYLAAHSFEEFILLSPKTHFERVYLLSF